MNFRDGVIIMLLLWQDHSKLNLVLSTGKNICHHVIIMKCVIATSPIRKKRGSCNGCYCNYYNIIQSSVLGKIISGFIFAQTTKTSSPDKMFWIIKRTETLKTWKYYLCMFAEKTFQLSFGSLRGLKLSFKMFKTQVLNLIQDDFCQEFQFILEWNRSFLSTFQFLKEEFFIRSIETLWWNIATVEDLVLIEFMKHMSDSAILF